MKQFRAIVTGHVQGVCFRAETVSVARRLGCRGFARNLPTGQVEVVAAGSEEALEALLAFLRRGPRLARVDDLQVRWEAATVPDPSFEVRY